MRCSGARRTRHENVGGFPRCHAPFSPWELAGREPGSRRGEPAGGLSRSAVPAGPRVGPGPLDRRSGESRAGRVQRQGLGDYRRNRWRHDASGRKSGGQGPTDAGQSFGNGPNIVVAAIRRAGLNRPRIRDAVQANSPARGITGVIEWDAQGQNHRVVPLRALASP